MQIIRRRKTYDVAVIGSGEVEKKGVIANLGLVF